MSSESATRQQPARTAGTEIVNDFSIQVATVNGSGSQTANLVLIRSLFQMGIPVSGKNLFPSNIAGLPTWYTIRANKHGYIGRKKEIDLLVAMNPETAREDVLGPRRGRGGRLRRAAEAQRGARGPGVLPGALRRAGQADLPGRQAAQARAQHDLRRRPLEAARHRDGGDGEGPEQAARQEGEGGGPQPGGPRRGIRLRRAAPAQARPVPRRADGQDARQDPHRGQRGGGDRRHDGGRDGGHLVPDHALVDGGRDAHRLHEEVPPRQGDGKGHLRDRPGRGRARVDRHGARRGLGRRALDDGHLRPRHLADGRVHRPGLLHRGARGHRRRAARRAVHGPADAHRAGRHPVDGGAVARRHEAHHAHPQLGGGVLRADDGGLRPGGAVPDAGVRHDRPRPRHEHLDGRLVHRIRRSRSTAASGSTRRS